MSTKVNKITCPRCHSSNLYRFGKDKLGRGIYLHHDYKDYSQYTCNFKKCNHSIYVPKPIFIVKSSCELISGKHDFSRMRFPIFLIITALNLYFLNGSSTRRISQFFKSTFNVNVSHVIIASWCKKFAPIFITKANKLLKGLTLGDSDEWHAISKFNPLKMIYLIVSSKPLMILLKICIKEKRL